MDKEKRMKDINRVAITGHLTSDAELKVTQGGTEVLSFGVGVNESRKNAQGEWEDRPSFFDCVKFGASQNIVGYLTKGTPVAVEGRLTQRRWQDKESGQNRSKVEIIADTLKFYQRSGGQGRTSATQAQGGPVNPTQGAGQTYDEDIPF
jgi:single-strand DNA-binding protein